MRTARPLLLTTVLLATACRDDEPLEDPTPDAGVAAAADAGPTEPDPDAGFVDSGEPPPPVVDLTWEPCGDLAGTRREGVDCATYASALDPADPGSDEITLFAKRATGEAPDGRRVVLLAGGPGFAGDSMEPLAATLIDADPGLTVLLPDHRGTGRSSKLGCAGPEGPFSEGGPTIVGPEWPQCWGELSAEYGEGLQHFTSFEAARDVAALIEATGDGPAFVLGVSYGTFWASRYLQLFPQQAAGVIFDSLCPPGHCFIADQDRDENEVAQAWFTEVCGAHPVCDAKLGGDPWGFLQGLHTKLREGHCPVFSNDGPANAGVVRQVTSSFLLQADLRPALPAMLYRIDRCDPADVTALQNLFSGGGGGASSTYSFPLAVNVAMLEMWPPDDPSGDTLATALDTYLSARGVSAQTAAQADGWPASVRPERTFALPRSRTPALMLAATYDPATRIELARPLVEALDGPHQTFVEFAHGSHNLWTQSRRLSDPETRCGMEIILQFLGAPTEPLDTSCARDLLPSNFAGTEAYANALFGTPDLWEN